MIPTPSTLNDFDEHGPMLRLERLVVATPRATQLTDIGITDLTINRSCMTPGDKDALGIEELPVPVGGRGVATPLNYDDILRSLQIAAQDTARYDSAAAQRFRELYLGVPASPANDRAQDAYERERRIARVEMLKAQNDENYAQWQERMDARTQVVHLDGDPCNKTPSMECSDDGTGGPPDILMAWVKENGGWGKFYAYKDDAGLWHADPHPAPEL